MGHPSVPPARQNPHHSRAWPPVEERQMFDLITGPCNVLQLLHYILSLLSNSFFFGSFFLSTHEASGERVCVSKGIIAMNS